ncbi:AKL1, partial [Symbiodinium pilosum]
VELFFTQRTTPMFRPPELADPDLLRFPITTQADLFMLGLCLFQMLFRVHAFPLEGQLANIHARYSLPASAHSAYSKEQLATLESLLRQDPRQRPTAQELALTGFLQCSSEA